LVWDICIEIYWLNLIIIRIESLRTEYVARMGKVKEGNYMRELDVDGG